MCITRVGDAQQAFAIRQAGRQGVVEHLSRVGTQLTTTIRLIHDPIPARTMYSYPIRVCRAWDAP